MFRKFSALAIPLVVFITMAAACSRHKQPVSQAKAPITNLELQNRVRAKLDGDPQIKAADLVIVPYVEKQQVTISGIVKSEDLRKKAVSLAESALAGITVVDNITVPPQELARTNHKTVKKVTKAHFKRTSTK